MTLHTHNSIEPTHSTYNNSSDNYDQVLEQLRNLTHKYAKEYYTKNTDPSLPLDALSGILANNELSSRVNVERFYKALDKHFSLSQDQDVNNPSKTIREVLKDDQTGRNYFLGVLAIAATIAGFLAGVVPGLVALAIAHVSAGSVSKAYGTFFTGAGKQYVNEVDRLKPEQVESSPVAILEL